MAFKRVQPLDSGLTVRVFVSKTRGERGRDADDVRTLLAFGLVSCIILVGVQAASDRLLLRPIAQLTSASRRLAAGDLGARVAASTTIPELNELGKDFDDMAAALEEREAARLRVRDGAEGSRAAVSPGAEDGRRSGGWPAASRTTSTTC